MSEPKLVSPLLDGFIMGEPISDHHGVRCCPAIRENTDERYIVKIISIPASQVQLDALLLTGAYSDSDEALAYFKELSDGVVGESDILDRLSRLEGYTPYAGHQIQQMDDGVGYDVYLVSKYRRSLKKLMRTNPLTHLDAVNIGLDMCAALTVSRQAGYLYADLKPGNIFLSDTQGYQIGDLGFIPLSSLRYASLPEKYRSSYTAPEVNDAMAALNDTIDIYALGLTLYQVYNNGELPFDGAAPAQPLPSPMYADYEMADIILKACAPRPEDRWQDPAQMGQALINYMQRNSVNDTPIVPPPIIEDEVMEEPEEFLSEEENAAELADLLAAIPDEEPPAIEVETSIEDAETSSEEALPVNGDVVVPEEEPSASDVPDEDDEDMSPADASSSDSDSIPEAVNSEESVQLSFLDILEEDETTPSEETAELLTDTEVTDEVAQMLAQADDLIAHELPEPVVAPAPIDVPIPPPIVIEPEAEEIQEESVEEPIPCIISEEITEVSSEDDVKDALTDEPIEEDEPEEIWDEEEKIIRKPSAKRWIAVTIILLLLAGVAIGGYFWYNEYYLQSIDTLEVLGSDDTLTVRITSDVDENLLTVICTDTYGNAKRSSVMAGTAVFTDLNPSTQYRIEVEISGVHKLTGTTTGSYTTDAQTEIMNFTAIGGPEDGSVILNFAVTGPEPEQWAVEYSSPSEAAKTATFTGHTVTITGLTVGNTYTFRLVQAPDIHLSGTYELTYTARNIVYAQDLKITACGNGSMTVQWALPEGVTTQTWIVRCYNDAGYDQSLTTAETTVTFTDLDHTSGYTVTVTAEGMTQSVDTKVSADPVHVTGFNTTLTDPWAMTLNWDYTGAIGANGWILTCSINDGEAIVLLCETNSCIIALVPGSSYRFEVRPADEITYFADPFTYGPVETAVFKGYDVTASDMSFSMCLTPKKAKWDKDDLKASDYKTTFAAGEKASFLVHMGRTYKVSEDNIVTTFVIRDSENNLISTGTQTRTWRKMWYQRYCELDIPELPAQAGNYQLDIYFNGMYVTTQQFTIT